LNESAGVSQPLRLSLVVPAFNEAEILAHAISRFVADGRRFVERGLADSFQLVVVDDGSTDATAEVLAAAEDEFPEVLGVFLDINGGLGAALRAGFGAADGTHVAYTDADLPFDLAALDSVLGELRCRPDVVHRAVRRSRRGTGPRRFVYSVGYQYLIAALFGRNLYDINFAGKVIPAERLGALEQSGRPLASRGSFIDAEMLLRLAAGGAEIRTFRVEYQPRAGGQSTLSSPRVIRQIFGELWRMRVASFAAKRT
jgi:glycosyltransferase involved in cell wall biosynthesis